MSRKGHMMLKMMYHRFWNYFFAFETIKFLFAVGNILVLSLVVLMINFITLILLWLFHDLQSRLINDFLINLFVIFITIKMIEKFVFLIISVVIIISLCFEYQPNIKKMKEWFLLFLRTNLPTIVFMTFTNSPRLVLRLPCENNKILILI